MLCFARNNAKLCYIAPLRGGENDATPLCFQNVPLVHTRGFASDRQLNRHFAKHARDLGLKTIAEYEECADRFLGSARPSHVRECTRRHGDLVRFDPVTDLYGILGTGGVIRTCFRPVPCSSVIAVRRAIIRLAGLCHGHSTNLDYYQAECRK